MSLLNSLPRTGQKIAGTARDCKRKGTDQDMGNSIGRLFEKKETETVGVEEVAKLLNSAKNTLVRSILIFLTA